MNTYESPELFELGNAEDVTLSCACGGTQDCDCKEKNEVLLF